MKYTIEGFSQEYAVKLKKDVDDNGKKKTIKIDCTDLVVLRWFVDFYPNMIKMHVDGKEYAKLTHKKMLEDLPILDVSRKACIERMQKLVAFGILDYKIIKDGGTFSLYRFGENYINLISKDVKEDTGCPVNSTQGGRSTVHPVVGQPDNKDNSIIYSSIKDSSIRDREKPAGFRPPTVEEVKAYCTERKNGIDAERFCDFYASKGWKVGNTKMKDWKASVRTWEKRDAEKNPKHINNTEDDILDGII